MTTVSSIWTWRRLGPKTLWRLKTYRGCGFLSLFLTTQKEMRQLRWIEYSHILVNETKLQGTEDTELTLTREGDYIGSPASNVEEINIFEGQYNRITFAQVYSKVFKCTYQLQLYPFDTQVPTILKKSSIILHYHSFNPLISIFIPFIPCHLIHCLPFLSISFYDALTPSMSTVHCPAMFATLSTSMSSLLVDKFPASLEKLVGETDYTTCNIISIYVSPIAVNKT